MTADAEPAVRVELLGPVRVWRDGALVGPAGRLRRGLLAMLALHANHVVPVDELVDGLWGSEPPASAVNLVQTYVSAWRHSLEPDRSAHGASDRLRTAGAGYQLVLQVEESDLLGLESMATRGARLLAMGATDDGVELLGRVVLDGQARPLADLTGLPFVGRAVEDLESRRVQVLELWAQHCLEHRAGDLNVVCTALDEAGARDPLRERLAELAMWARCRLGRPAEALVLFERIRRLLAEELGADPGVGLREMHAGVLADAPALRPARKPLATSNRRGIRPRSDLFVGRTREVREVAKLLSEVGLVTLTGPGGSGKTRLAEQVAAASEDRFPEGAALVPFADVRDFRLVPAAVAEAIGLKVAAGEDPLTLVADRLADADFLLVLDNLEHLPDAARTIDALRERTVRMRLLVTSRHPLGLEAEHLYPVGPLEVPDANEGTAEELANIEAVQLLADRVRAVLPTFEVTEANYRTIGQIAQRVDGLPLGLEIAAGWVPILGPDPLLERLSASHSLANRRPDQPERHRTLEETIAWSYRLLNADNQRLLARFSVFRRSATLAAVEGVCGPDLSRPTLELVADLCDRNLLLPVPGPGQPRFRMLETIREFAAARLADENEPDVLDRHRCWYAAWAQSLAGHTEGASASVWLAEAAADDENLRAAIDAHSHDPAEQLQMVVDCMALWHELGHNREGIERLEQALADAPAEASARAMATACLAWLLVYVDPARAAVMARAAIALAESSADPLVGAFAWQTLASASQTSAETRRALQRAVSLAERGAQFPVRYECTSPAAVQAGAMAGLGNDAMFRDVPEATRLFRACRDLDEGRSEVAALLVDNAKLANVLLLAGNVDQAELELRKCEELITLGINPWAAKPLGLAQGLLALHQGRHGRAAEHYREVFERSWADGTLHNAVVAAGMLTDVLLLQDRPAHAEQILDRAERMARTAPVEFQVILWVRRARLHRLRRELILAAELLDRSAQALDTEMLLPERIVWYVERVALAELQGRPDQAGSALEDLNRRVKAAGMVIPPWDIRHLPSGLGQT